MIVILALVWLLLKENERANRFAEELYQQEEISPWTEINWIPTYIILQDPQGRPRARGTIYPIYTVFDTEVK